MLRDHQIKINQTRMEQTPMPDGNGQQNWVRFYRFAAEANRYDPVGL